MKQRQITKNQFEKFLKANNLTIKIIPVWEGATDRYKMEVYYKGHLIADGNEFYKKEPNYTWAYEYIMDLTGSYEWEKYVDVERFKTIEEIEEIEEDMRRMEEIKVNLTKDEVLNLLTAAQCLSERKQKTLKLYQDINLSENFQNSTIEEIKLLDSAYKKLFQALLY
ncbi:hypothetical protein D2962_05955 [Biomaibacter acetigenes]|uniref:Uncharacterized protein n=1 Tax=Biomaibacter acetigenes TaxID=2316383 RepID=A0A3G2R4D2_9FIRM|nr:hypothetical protein [Biomaibacter acetigenes]AYO30221.1 hypothetical protein D2962_05955 [Biomaibacter acetigenes]